LLFMIAAGIATQTELQSRWGANAFTLSGWLVMAHVGQVDLREAVRRALRFALPAHLLLCLALTLPKTVLADHFHVATRANYPGHLLAERALQTWRAHTDAPLRIVATDIWLGGNIVANTSDRIAVLIDGRHFKSPWIRDSAMRACGVLVLDDLGRDPHDRADQTLAALLAKAQDQGVWELPWGGNAGAGGQPQRIHWGIIAPQPGLPCAIGRN
jgi:hypothetical protein